MMRQLGLFEKYDDEWAVVEAHLEAKVHDFAAAGDVCRLTNEWIPLRARYHAGERTRELANAVMAL